MILPTLRGTGTGAADGKVGHRLLHSPAALVAVSKPGRMDYHLRVAGALTTHNLLGLCPPLLAAVLAHILPVLFWHDIACLLLPALGNYADTWLVVVGLILLQSVAFCDDETPEACSSPRASPTGGGHE